MKTSKLRNLVLLLALVTLLGAGGISAYMTSTDTAKNNFEVEKVSVELTEPNFEDGQEVTPNMTIPKDPTVTNDGTADAYVFVSVKVPADKVVTANETGEKNPKARKDLFMLNNIDPSWHIVKNELVVDEKGNTYREFIYAYANSDTELRTLTAGETTPAVFESVTMANIIEGEEFHKTELENSIREIYVDVFAIQTNDIDPDENGSDVKDPSRVLEVYYNQNPYMVWNTFEE